jgi:hypothetical protein
VLSSERGLAIPPSADPEKLLGRSDWRLGELLATVLWLIAAIVFFSDAALSVVTSNLWLLFGLFLIASWVRRFRRGQVPLVSPRNVALGLAVPASGLLGLVLLATDLGLLVRLKLSQPALNRLVAEFREDGRVDYESNRRIVGLFGVKSVQVQGDLVKIETGSANWMDSGGLLYSHGANPPRKVRKRDLWHLDGPWWRYVDVF